MRTRAGFTLIELMVSMALTLFVMVILSQAFILSLETFSGMKGIGDMQVNLRTAEVMLRADLSQDHFEGDRRLSDQTATGGSQIFAPRPQAGFFAVRRGSASPSLVVPSVGPPYPPYANEGKDASQMNSLRAVDHMIYMTVKRKGNRQENFFTAPLSGTAPVLNTFFNKPTAYGISSANLPYSTLTTPYTFPNTTGFYSSQWAEVLYYLFRSGSTEEPNNPASTLGTPTFSLYRAQFVMVPDPTSVSTLFPNALALQTSTFSGMSCNPGATKLTFFSPADAAQGQGKRMIPNFTPTGFNPATNVNYARVDAAKTLVMPSVISFHVQVMQLGPASTLFIDVPQPVAGATYGLYDTAPLVGPANLGLKGIQVTLRVWDNKTRQTRQVTIMQDL
jgi:prepilin-type N-terminal cleavage/methylation domain-containing protein